MILDVGMGIAFDLVDNAKRTRQVSVSDAMGKGKQVQYFKSIALAMFLGVATIGLTTTSALAIVITQPTSLVAGDQYRLAFVSSRTRDSLSNDIQDYNDFVTFVANLQTDLSDLGTNWSAIASTEFVSAIENTATDPTPLGLTGVPIFLVNDTKLVDNYDDLWDGNIDVAFFIDEAGNGVPNRKVWTGTAADGTAVAGLTLGAGLVVNRSGNAVVVGSGWVSQFNTSRTGTLSLYALSEILTIPGATSIPEPGTLALFGIGLVGFGLMRRRRKAA